MELIDDEGNLFGLVNVIDTIVVLLVASVVVASVAFVLQPEPEPPAPPETATTQAVLDLGIQPPYVVEQISVGDSSSAGPTGELTVTDVYFSPGQDGAHTLVSVELTDVVRGDIILYNGEPLRLGRQLAIQTDQYQVTGTLRDVGTSLSTETTETLLETTVDASTASQIDPGDAYSLAGRDVATVKSVESYATWNPDQRRVFVGLSLNTVDFGNGPQFGNILVRQGTTIPIQTTDYALTGEIRRVSATELRGEPTTRTVTLQLSNVGPQLADDIEAGMTERNGDETVARITNVETEPATVIVTSQDGQVFLREHPIQRDVTLTADIQVRETTNGPTFKGRSIQQGSTVVVDLGSITVEARVASI